MPIADLDQLKLYYETLGSGDPLMLVAGLGSDSQSWQSITADLARHDTVITFDNRGVGRTTPLNTDISIRKMADDCISLMKHLGLPSVSLLGHSMGGLIAMDCAIRHPECVNRLILAGTSMPISKRNHALLSDWATWLESGMDLRLWLRNVFYWIFTARFFEDEEAVEEAIRFELSYPYPIDKAAFRKQFEALAEFNCTAELSRITAKTLVIAGKEDLLITPDECAMLAKAIPNSAFRVVERTAHSLHTENPTDFLDYVLKFLSGS
jgi:pimeloyl-ACP methyl ester carboxylesterase